MFFLLLFLSYARYSDNRLNVHRDPVVDGEAFRRSEAPVGVTPELKTFCTGGVTPFYGAIYWIQSVQQAVCATFSPFFGLVNTIIKTNVNVESSTLK